MLIGAGKGAKIRLGEQIADFINDRNIAGRVKFIKNRLRKNQITARTK